jgi:hypothetical protein
MERKMKDPTSPALGLGHHARITGREHLPSPRSASTWSLEKGTPTNSTSSLTFGAMADTAALCASPWDISIGIHGNRFLRILWPTLEI